VQKSKQILTLLLKLSRNKYSATRLHFSEDVFHVCQHIYRPGFSYNKTSAENKLMPVGWYEHHVRNRIFMPAGKTAGFVIV
jgi:hypothetical protein